MGLLEIAERLEVRPQTARMWRTRGTRPPMPEPRWTVSGLPCWEWGQISDWWALRASQRPHSAS